MLLWLFMNLDESCTDAAVLDSAATGTATAATTVRAGNTDESSASLSHFFSFTFPYYSSSLLMGPLAANPSFCAFFNVSHRLTSMHLLVFVPSFRIK